MKKLQWNSETSLDVRDERVEWFQKKEDHISMFITDTYARVFAAKEEEWDSSHGVIWV